MRSVEQDAAAEVLALLPTVLRAVADALDPQHDDDRQEQERQRQTIAVGRLIVDKRTRRIVTPRGIDAPPAQTFDVLAALADNAGCCVTYADIWAAAWSHVGPFDRRRDKPAISTQVARVRAVIADTGTTVTSVHGRGFILEARP